MHIYDIFAVKSAQKIIYYNRGNLLPGNRELGLQLILTIRHPDGNLAPKPSNLSARNKMCPSFCTMTRNLLTEGVTMLILRQNKCKTQK